MRKKTRSTVCPQAGKHKNVRDSVLLFPNTSRKKVTHTPLRPLNQDTSALKSCPQPPPHSPSIQTDIPLPALDLMLFKHTEF